MNLWIRDSLTIEAARVKKIYNPAIKFYKISYKIMPDRSLKVKVLE